MEGDSSGYFIFRSHAVEPLDVSASWAEEEPPENLPPKAIKKATLLSYP